MLNRFRVLNRLGRRGLVLALFGLAWLIQGMAFFILPGMSGGSDFWIDRLPAPVQGALWLASGVMSLVAAFRKRKNNDTFGFLAVSSMPLLLTSSYLVGCFTRLVFTHDPTWLLGLLGFSIWGVISLALGVIASWPEVPQKPTANDGGG